MIKNLCVFFFLLLVPSRDNINNLVRESQHFCIPALTISSYYLRAFNHTGHDLRASFFYFSLVVIAYASCCLRAHIEVVTNIRKKKSNIHILQ